MAAGDPQVMPLTLALLPVPYLCAFLFLAVPDITRAFVGTLCLWAALWFLTAMSLLMTVLSMGVMAYYLCIPGGFVAGWLMVAVQRAADQQARGRGWVALHVGFATLGGAALLLAFTGGIPAGEAPRIAGLALLLLPFLGHGWGGAMLLAREGRLTWRPARLLAAVLLVAVLGAFSGI